MAPKPLAFEVDAVLPDDDTVKEFIAPPQRPAPPPKATVSADQMQAAVQQQAHVEQQRAQAMQVLMLALQTLGKRALIAVSNLFTLVTVGSAWWLWMSVPDPNTHQLVYLGGYALFVLVINFIVGKKTTG